MLVYAQHDRHIHIYVAFPVVVVGLPFVPGSSQETTRRDLSKPSGQMQEIKKRKRTSGSAAGVSTQPAAGEQLESEPHHGQPTGLAESRMDRQEQQFTLDYVQEQIDAALSDQNAKFQSTIEAAELRSASAEIEAKRLSNELDELKKSIDNRLREKEDAMEDALIKQRQRYTCITARMV